MFGSRHLGGPKLGLHDASDYYVLTGDNGNSALDLSQLLGTSSSVGDIGTGSSSGMYLDIPLSQQLQVGNGLGNLDVTRSNAQMQLLAANAARDALYVQQTVPGALTPTDAWGAPGLLALQDEHLNTSNGLLGLGQGGLVQDDLQTTLLLQHLQQLQFQQQQQHQHAVAAAAVALQQQQAQQLAEQQLLAQLAAASQAQHVQPMQVQSSLQVQRLMQSMAQNRRSTTRLPAGNRNLQFLNTQQSMPQQAAGRMQTGLSVTPKSTGAIKAQPPTWAGADWNPRAQAQAAPTSGTGVFLPNMPAAPKDSGKSIKPEAKPGQQGQSQQAGAAGPVSGPMSSNSLCEPKSVASEPPVLASHIGSTFSTVTSQLSQYYEEP